MPTKVSRTRNMTETITYLFLVISVSVVKIIQT